MAETPDELRELLIGEIRGNGMSRGQALPSIRELSRRYGVTKAVAERATRSLVADGICYAEQGKGIFVAVEEPAEIDALLRTSTTICVVFGFLEYARSDHHFFRQVYEGTQEWIAGNRFNVLKLYSWRAKSPAVKDRELQRFAPAVDGFLTLGIYSDEDCIRLRNTGLPVAAIDYDAALLGIDSATFENYGTMKELVSRVVARQPGEILYVSVQREKMDDPSLVERRKALKDVLAAAGRSFDPQKQHVELHVDDGSEDGRLLEAVRGVIGGAPPALIFEDEYLVARAARALEAGGLRAGEDYLLAYVGPADLPEEIAALPALVAAYDFRALGRAGIELLNDRMKTGPGRPVRTTVPGELREQVPALRGG
jgi:DNA-binding LacI/PurR family transcriptional regulator